MAITDSQRQEVLALFGTSSDEVCYGYERLKKLGVEPYSAERRKASSPRVDCVEDEYYDCEALERKLMDRLGYVPHIGRLSIRAHRKAEAAAEQAKNTKTPVAIYISPIDDKDINGLFVVSPYHFNNPPEAIYPNLRWDKPICEQQAEEHPLPGQRFSWNQHQQMRWIYGQDNDEICYAHDRLQRMGVQPCSEHDYALFPGEKLEHAIRQAKKTGCLTAVYLEQPSGYKPNGIKGLFVVSPYLDSPATAFSTLKTLSQNPEYYRWDKPIKTQEDERKVLPGELFSLEHKKIIAQIYGQSNDEICYAHERLKKIGGEPFRGEMPQRDNDILQGFFFTRAMKQAKRMHRDIAIRLKQGIFVVSPDPAADDSDYCLSKWEEYTKNPENYRWDKPIQIQKSEEAALSRSNNTLFSAVAAQNIPEY